MTNPKPDLSRVPEDIRRKLEERLASLPGGLRTTLETQLAKLQPGQLDELMQRGSPLLEKLLGRVDQLRSKADIRKPAESAFKQAQASIKPVGHYNQTVQAGDQPGLVSKVLFGLGLVAALYYLL